MPENGYQWAWFVFFVGGTIGGWIILYLIATAAVREFRVRRFMRKAEPE
jgi:hypothetical protein